MSSDVVRGAHHVTRHISQKALETLPEDGNVRPKHVGAPIENCDCVNNCCICCLFTHIFNGDFNF